MTALDGTLMVKGCPVALSVIVTLLAVTAVTVPVTWLTSTKLPSVPTVEFSVTVTLGLIERVPVVFTNDEPTFKSMAICAGVPDVSVTGALKFAVTVVDETAGASWQTMGGVPAALGLLQVVVPSVKVSPGSTVTVAVPVPNVKSTPV